MKKASIVFGRWYDDEQPIQMSPCKMFSLFGVIVELIKFWLSNGGLNKFNSIHIICGRKETK